jgi:hypothetical protein
MGLKHAVTENYLDSLQRKYAVQGYHFFSENTFLFGPNEFF